MPTFCECVISLYNAVSQNVFIKIHGGHRHCRNRRGGTERKRKKSQMAGSTIKRRATLLSFLPWFGRSVHLSADCLRHSFRALMRYIVLGKFAGTQTIRGNCVRVFLALLAIEGNNSQTSSSQRLNVFRIWKQSTKKRTHIGRISARTPHIFSEISIYHQIFCTHTRSVASAISATSILCESCHK